MTLLDEAVKGIGAGAFTTPGKTLFKNQIKNLNTLSDYSQELMLEQIKIAAECKNTDPDFWAEASEALDSMREDLEKGEGAE